MRSHFGNDLHGLNVSEAVTSCPPRETRAGPAPVRIHVPARPLFSTLFGDLADARFAARQVRRIVGGGR